MKFGIIVIGDEILNGRRQDKHLRHTVETLANRGLELSWCRILADEPALLVANFRQTMACPEVVFSFGGIGATPDDHTRLCAAQAAGLELTRHPDALREIEAQFGEQAYPVRIRMAEFPAGSSIIPNPINRVPGFSLARHHFLPGFPAMAWPMLEWVLDNRYAELQMRHVAQGLLRVFDVAESELVDLMEAFLHRYPELHLSSLPHMTGSERRFIELGVRGEPDAVPAGMDFLRQAFATRHYRWEDGTGN